MNLYQPNLLNIKRVEMSYQIINFTHISLKYQILVIFLIVYLFLRATTTFRFLHLLLGNVKKE